MLYKIGIILSIAVLFHSTTCSRVLDTHSQPALNVSDYCSRIGDCGEGSHVMCLYNSTRAMGSTCWDFLTNTSITPDYAHYILSITNRIRSKIASGQVKSASGETFPKAYGMLRVLWDEELATFAQVWANQCTLHQDMCRSSRKFPNVGQALGMSRLSLNDWMPVHKQHFTETYLTPAKVKFAIKQVMKAWWESKEKIDPINVKMLTQLKLVHSNKFLNLVYGPLTHIGCGISVYKEYAYKDNMADLFFNCIQIVCNFSARPKVGEPVYTVDPPTKPGYTVRCGCPAGYDEDEDCLCYETGRKIPYYCTDKDQCKPPVVVLPIFTVEDASPSRIGNRTSTVREMSTDILDRFDMLNKRMPSNNKDIFTNLEAVDFKSDVTRRFPSDVRSRYFKKQSKTALLQNTTNVPYHLAGIARARHVSRQKPSIFLRAEIFELPVKKRKQDTVNINHDHQTKEYKKDVAPRKDFTKVQKLVSSYLDKKRHGKPIDLHFDNDGYMTHGPVTFSDYNNATKEKLKVNKNDVAYKKPRFTYVNNFNVTKLKHLNINPTDTEEGDTKLMFLLDKLEEEVKNIDLNTKEKGMFDQKIRKIYGTLVGRPDLLNQKFKLISKDFINETITGDINFSKLSGIDQINAEKYDLNLNKPKYNYRDFENNYNSVTNFENKLEKMYGNKLFNDEAKKFFNSELKSILHDANDNFEKRKFRNIHDLRENRNNNEYHHSRSNGEHYPIGSERRGYYRQKLANLQNQINNIKRNGLPKEHSRAELEELIYRCPIEALHPRSPPGTQAPEDRHTRPVRPTKRNNQQRRRRPNEHVNSYYMPGRARFLHGF